MDDVKRPTAVVLTALPLEYQAVRTHLTDIEKLVHHPSGTRAERGRLPGTRWHIALMETGEGSLTAAAVTERVHTWLQPEALFFVGVAGGLKDDIRIGDVVVATKVYGVHGGKQTSEGLRVRPEVWRSSHRLEQAARHALRGQAHFKPIAVGDVVLADAQSALARHIHENYNDAVAYEMEGAGVAHAAHLTGRLDALVVRGISDKADAHKHERDAEGSQPRAAMNAAAAAVAVIRELAATELPDNGRLTEYLKAARSAAGRHPYPLIVDIPEEERRLALIYQGLQATPQHGPRLDGRGERTGTPGTDGGPSAAEAILTGERTVVVVAGPGGGKSSLLRTCLDQGAARWLTGHGEGVVPVLIRATALDGQLSEALAAAVNKELAADLGEEFLPPAFFANPPRPGVRWLVLVDGLDEIPDTEGRRRILRLIAATAKGARADLYRFVVATRRLPGAELDVLGPEVPRYDLRPFRRDDLQQVASRWFVLLKLPDAEAQARQLTQKLEQGRLTELARIPLMASLLCQFHILKPDQPLPKDRSGIYGKFVEQLYKQNVHKQVGEIQGRAVADLTRIFQVPQESEAVREAAVAVQNSLEKLIEYLAHHRASGAGGRAVEVLATHPLARCPANVGPAHWNRFLESLLHTTGLLVEDGGDCSFLHQTFQEFLAVRYLTRDARAAARALHKAFHQPVHDGLLTRSPALSLRLCLGKYWHAPSQNDSYVGFLIDATQKDNLELCTRYLTRLASPRAVGPGHGFLAEQAQLGTRLPSPVLHTVGQVLYALATDTPSHGPQTSSGNELRVQGAEQLAQLGDPRAADVLHGLATDTTFRGNDRVKAAMTLAGLGPRGADLLLSLVTDTTLDDRARVQAAKALAGLGDARAVDLLLALATDHPAIDGSSRVYWAVPLAELEDTRAADVLHALATDTALESSSRALAARTLAEVGDPRTGDLLHSLSADLSLEGDQRVRTADSLAELGDRRAPDLYAMLATDTTLDSDPRVRAVDRLAELGDRRAGDLYVTLATDTTLDCSSRAGAAHWLAGRKDARTAEVLHFLAMDTTMCGDHRAAAAIGLSGVGDARAADLLCARVTDTNVSNLQRLAAASALSGLGDVRAADLLYALATDTTVESGLRRWAVLELEVLDDPRATAARRWIGSHGSGGRRIRFSRRGRADG
ncbi:HEAT repeat domain-containing protein [Streptomyces adustus]|uniref:phosphorylase family protein n=1 Tax=Streptomyces adustus TaxID=1609272 RepID=UPI0035DD641B